MLFCSLNQRHNYTYSFPKIKMQKNLNRNRIMMASTNNTGIPGGPRVLGPVSELWDGSLNSGVGTPEFWGTSDAFCVVSA